MAATVKVQAKNLANKKIATSQSNNQQSNNQRFDYNNEVDRYFKQDQASANGRYDQLYDKQLADSRFTSRQSAQLQDRRADEDNARRQVNEDRSSNERASIRASQPIAGGSGSESFGLGAAAPNGYNFNAYGQRGLYDASAVADWRQRQSGVLNDMYNQEKGRSDLDRDKQMSIANNQAGIQTRLTQQQQVAESQRSGNERAFQSQQSDKDRANQRYLAQIESNTRLQQSIFSGNGNGFQYWGGSI